MIPSPAEPAPSVNEYVPSPSFCMSNVALDPAPWLFVPDTLVYSVTDTPAAVPVIVIDVMLPDPPTPVTVTVASLVGDVPPKLVPGITMLPWSL